MLFRSAFFKYHLLMYLLSKYYIDDLVLLPGFQKGKKGQFASYKEKLEKRTEFHSFYRVNKMFSLKF
jgi:hypothetical protein